MSKRIPNLTTENMHDINIALEDALRAFKNEIPESLRFKIIDAFNYHDVFAPETPTDAQILDMVDGKAVSL